MVVRERHHADAGARERVRAGRGAREHERLARVLGLSALVAELVLEVDEAHVGGREQRRDGGERIVRRIAEQLLAERLAEADVAAGEERDRGGGGCRRRRWRPARRWRSAGAAMAAQRRGLAGSFPRRRGCGRRDDGRRREPGAHVAGPLAADLRGRCAHREEERGRAHRERRLGAHYPRARGRAWASGGTPADVRATIAAR